MTMENPNNPMAFKWVEFFLDETETAHFSTVKIFSSSSNWNTWLFRVPPCIRQKKKHQQKNQTHWAKGQCNKQHFKVNLSCCISWIWDSPQCERTKFQNILSQMVKHGDFPSKIRNKSPNKQTNPSIYPRNLQQDPLNGPLNLSI